MWYEQHPQQFLLFFPLAALDVPHQEDEADQEAHGDEEGEEHLLYVVDPGILGGEAVEDDVGKDGDRYDPERDHKDEEADFVLSVESLGEEVKEQKDTSWYKEQID